MRAKGVAAWNWNEFSLVDGGPLHRLWQRLHLAGHLLQLLCGRIGVLLFLVWVPLLVLTLIEGSAWSVRLKLPFIYDIETHLRLLVVLPLLVFAEDFVHQKLRPIVGQFVLRNLIDENLKPQFEASVAAAMRLRNSVSAELILLVSIYAVGLLFARPASGGLHVPSWRGIAFGDEMQWSQAGLWLRWVSFPLFQFLLLRWYFRLFIWTRFLWQVSKLKLNIIPTHPDRSGGLGFLAAGSLAYAPVLLAQGTLLTARMSNAIFFDDASLTDFKLEVIGLAVIMVVVTLAPLMVFSPKLAAAKRAGWLDYGSLAQRYVFEFDRKWRQGGTAGGEPLIGSADIQSLADLGNALSVIERMRLAPFGLQTVLQVSILTLMPVLPLVLTMIPLQELSARLLKLVI